MKLSSRGFTLVELMIVMSIIGILAAVLFPSVTKYLANGRDTSRISGIAQIGTAVVSYANNNNGSFPPGLPADIDCVNTGALAIELPKWPMDPVVSKNNGLCAVAGLYGYGTGSNSTNTPMFVLSANLESPSGGQVAGAGAASDTTIAGYQGNISSTTRLDNAPNVSQKKGVGSGYILVN